MKRIILLAISLFQMSGLIAQVDFAKLQQEYVSRKPALDSMHAYPDAPYSTLKVSNQDGITIAFWWMPLEKQKGTVLLAHGFFMNKSHMLGRARVYRDLGYNVMVMDLRARGESGGNAATSGPEVRSDVIAVINHYVNNLKDYGPLMLAGYSHGGRAIVFAAEKKQDAVKAIILESMPYSLTESFRRTFKVDPPPIPEGDIANTFRAVSAIPILLMIGSNDLAIVGDEALKIKGTFENPRSQLIIFDNAEHDLTVKKHHAFYFESIKTFLAAIK